MKNKIKTIKKKSIIVITSLMICLLSITGCSGSYNSIGNTVDNINVDTSENSIINLVMSSQYDLTSQNPYQSTYATDSWLMANLYDALIVANGTNELVGGVATSYEASDDYKTWTFHLRDDSYWVNYKGEKIRRVTSEDFITGLEWVLNYGKNEAACLYASIKFIVGSQEYFDYTESLTTEEARNLSIDVFLSMVGIEAPDEDTIIYHCIDSCPYFTSVVSSTEFYPAPKDHIDEIGIDQFLINNYMDAWFNGPYIITEYVPSNEIIFDANPCWCGNDENTRFLSITYKIVESSSVALQLYKNNEVDYVDLYLSQVRSLIDKESPYANYLTKQSPSVFSMLYLFNFQKYKQDGSIDENWNRAVANRNFRLSWYYGLDSYNELKNLNPISPYDNETETLNVGELVSLSDGTDYRDLVESKLELSDEENCIRRLNKDLYEECKEKAIEELTKQGVSFPIIADCYVLASSQSALDSALLLKNIIKECFGDDYIQLNILSYSSSYTREVVNPQKYAFADSSWGADYQDPVSVLSQYYYGDENAYLMDLMNIDNYSEEELKGEFSYMKNAVNSYKKFNELYDKANATIDDLDLRYELFAEAESYLISEAYFIPMYSDRGWCLTKIDLSSKNNAAYGANNWRYVNIKTNTNGYTDAIWED